MSVETAQLFAALLTLGCIGLLVAVVVLAVAGRRNAGAAELSHAIHDAGPWIAFLVAATATVGSLYFSEVADFVPCRLCWFQRIAMYPLSAILLVGAVRRDPGVRWYVLPLAVIGASISAYHYLIEWRPELETGSCSLTGPACAQIWFRELGFVTLAFMALTGFLTILTLLFVRAPARLVPDPSRSGPDPERDTTRLVGHETRS
jgi:disulfide bond formation protein DsbB